VGRFGVFWGGFDCSGGVHGGGGLTRTASWTLGLFFGSVSHTYRRLPVPACPRKSRVGANSPTLCPTIDSVTNTGTCLRPSWTAMVCPTISGKIVEVRDQVFSIRLSPEAFIASTRAIRRSSTNGPFLLERLIACLSLAYVLAR